MWCDVGPHLGIMCVFFLYSLSTFMYDGAGNDDEIENSQKVIRLRWRYGDDDEEQIGRLRCMELVGNYANYG